MVYRVRTEPLWRSCYNANDPDGAWWRVDGPNMSCHWATYNRHGIRVGQGVSQSTMPSFDELVEWDTAAANIPDTVAAAGIDMRLVHDLYIRWTALPTTGQSINHATGAQERGVSCYAATINPITGRIVYAEGTGLAGAAIEYLMSGADCYLITGEFVGLGSDGEPLLADPRVLGQLEITADGFRIA